MSDAGPTFTRLDHAALIGLGEARRLGLADMIYAAAPEFYGLIPLERADAVALLSKQLGVPGTELADLHVMSDRGEDLAVFAAITSRAREAAKQADVLGIVRGLAREQRPVFMTALGAYAPLVEPLDVESLYLPRIAVAARARGQGLGRAGLRAFLQIEPSLPASLHVAADNRLAIALYESAGFAFVSDQSFDFRAMVRSASSNPV